MRKTLAVVLVFFYVSFCYTSCARAFAGEATLIAVGGRALTSITGGAVGVVATVGAGEAAAAVPIAINPVIAAGIVAATIYYYREDIKELFLGRPVYDSPTQNWFSVEPQGIMKVKLTQPTLGYSVPLTNLRDGGRNVPIVVVGEFSNREALGAAYIAFYDAGPHVQYGPKLSHGGGPYVYNIYGSDGNRVYIEAITYWEGMTPITEYWFVENTLPQVEAKSNIEPADLLYQIQDAIQKFEQPGDEEWKNNIKDKLVQIEAELNRQLLDPYTPTSAPPEVQEGAEKLQEAIENSPEVQEWIDGLADGTTIPTETTPVETQSIKGNVTITNPGALGHEINRQLTPQFDKLNETLDQNHEELKTKMDEQKASIEALPQQIKSKLAEDQPLMPPQPVFDGVVEEVEKENLRSLLDSIYQRFNATWVKSSLSVSISAEGSSSQTGSLSIAGMSKPVGVDLMPLQGALAACGTILLSLVAIRETYLLFK